MIISPNVRVIADMILANVTPSASIASGIKMHCGNELQDVMTAVQNSVDLSSLELFDKPLKILGLFAAYQVEFLDTFRDTAKAYDLTSDDYLARLMKIDHDSARFSLNLLHNMQLFVDAQSVEQALCYKVIGTITNNTVEHVMSYCNLQNDLLNIRIANFEKSNQI